MAIASGTTFVIVLALSYSVPGVATIAPALGFVVAWAILASAHSGLTWLVYSDLSGEPLSRATRLGASGGSNESPAAGPSWSVQVSLLAILVVGALVVVPSLRTSPVLLAAAVVMVASSWVDVAIMYAVHYARVDALVGGLRFPDQDERHFRDYLYVSLAVQTTFGSTDVVAVDRRARSIITGHGVLAFVFNTVIVAVIVSLLLGVA